MTTKFFDILTIIVVILGDSGQFERILEKRLKTLSNVIEKEKSLIYKDFHRFQISRSFPCLSSDFFDTSRFSVMRVSSKVLHDVLYRSEPLQFEQHVCVMGMYVPPTPFETLRTV